LTGNSIFGDLLLALTRESLGHYSGGIGYSAYSRS